MVSSCWREGTDRPDGAGRSPHFRVATEGEQSLAVTHFGRGGNHSSKNATDKLQHLVRPVGVAQTTTAPRGAAPDRDRGERIDDLFAVRREPSI